MGEDEVESHRTSNVTALTFLLSTPLAALIIIMFHPFPLYHFPTKIFVRYLSNREICLLLIFTSNLFSFLNFLGFTNNSVKSWPTITANVWLRRVCQQCMEGRRFDYISSIIYPKKFSSESPTMRTSEWRFASARTWISRCCWITSRSADGCKSLPTMIGISIGLVRKRAETFSASIRAIECMTTSE